jgi:hypothetical protein
LEDGTSINLYWLNGWRMGTYNSWDISKIQEYSITYLDYFKECLEMLHIELDFDSLDKSIMHTFVFCNPKIHFLSHEYKVFYWGDDLGHQFSEQTVVENKSEVDGYTLRGDDWVDVHTSPRHKAISDMLYQNRNKYAKKYDNYKDAVYRHICSVYLNRKFGKLLTATPVNSNTAIIIRSIASDLKSALTSTSIREVPVPDRILGQTDPKGIRSQTYDYKTIPFLVSCAKHNSD